MIRNPAVSIRKHPDGRGDTPGTAAAHRPDQPGQVGDVSPLLILVCKRGIVGASFEFFNGACTASERPIDFSEKFRAFPRPAGEEFGQFAFPQANQHGIPA